MMTNVDIALLMSEWEAGGADYPECPCCCADGQAHFINPETDFTHRPGCAMDLALAERGYATQDDRNAARKRIAEDRQRAHEERLRNERASAPTLVPPKPT